MSKYEDSPEGLLNYLQDRDIESQFEFDRHYMDAFDIDEPDPKGRHKATLSQRMKALRDSREEIYFQKGEGAGEFQNVIIYPDDKSLPNYKATIKTPNDSFNFHDFAYYTLADLQIQEEEKDDDCLEYHMWGFKHGFEKPELPGNYQFDTEGILLWYEAIAWLREYDQAVEGQFSTITKNGVDVPALTDVNVTEKFQRNALNEVYQPEGFLEDVNLNNRRIGLIKALQDECGKSGGASRKSKEEYTERSNEFLKEEGYKRSPKGGGFVSGQPTTKLFRIMEAGGLIQQCKRGRNTSIYLNNKINRIDVERLLEEHGEKVETEKEEEESGGEVLEKEGEKRSAVKNLEQVKSPASRTIASILNVEEDEFLSKDQVVRFIDAENTKEVVRSAFIAYTENEKSNEAAETLMPILIDNTELEPVEIMKIATKTLQNEKKYQKVGG